MNKNGFAKPVAVAAGFIFLCAAPGLTQAQSGPPAPMRTATSVLPSGAPSAKNSLPADDFAGLTYTDEQKAEIAQIRRVANSHRDAVLKDDKLTADQKDAMLLGFTRIEYGQIYKVLSPEQQKQVRHRITARQEADQAAKQKQHSRSDTIIVPSQ